MTREEDNLIAEVLGRKPDGTEPEKSLASERSQEEIELDSELVEQPA